MIFTAACAIMLQLKDRQVNIDKYRYQQKFEIIRYLDFKTMRNRHMLQKQEEVIRAEMAEVSSDSEFMQAPEKQNDDLPDGYYQFNRNKGLEENS